MNLHSICHNNMSKYWFESVNWTLRRKMEQQKRRTETCFIKILFLLLFTMFSVFTCHFAFLSAVMVNWFVLRYCSHVKLTHWRSITFIWSAPEAQNLENEGPLRRQSQLNSYLCNTVRPIWRLSVKINLKNVNWIKNVVSYEAISGCLNLLTWFSIFPVSVFPDSVSPDSIFSVSVSSCAISEPVFKIIEEHYEPQGTNLASKSNHFRERTFCCEIFMTKSKKMNEKKG